MLLVEHGDVSPLADPTCPRRSPHVPFALHPPPLDFLIADLGSRFSSQRRLPLAQTPLPSTPMSGPLPAISEPSPAIAFVEPHVSLETPTLEELANLLTGTGPLSQSLKHRGVVDHVAKVLHRALQHQTQSVEELVAAVGVGSPGGSPGRPLGASSPLSPDAPINRSDTSPMDALVPLQSLSSARRTAGGVAPFRPCPACAVRISGYAPIQTVGLGS